MSVMIIASKFNSGILCFTKLFHLFSKRTSCFGAYVKSKLNVNNVKVLH